MKIDNAGNVAGLYPAQGKTTKRKAGDDAGAAQVDSAPVENVAINPLASQINAVSQQMGSEPTFDAAKVEAIRNAIASGDFQINPDRIADGLITSTRQLLVN